MYKYARFSIDIHSHVRLLIISVIQSKVTVVVIVWSGLHALGWFWWLLWYA